MLQTKTLLIAASLLVASQAQAQYETRVVAKGLKMPTGIAVKGFGVNTSLIFSEVPTPGVSGGNGGMNGIFQLDMWNNKKSTLNMGEPEPLNLTLAPNGSIYWTCRTAGVILERNKMGAISVLMNNLLKPTGITALPDGNIAVTQVPTPGVSGANGGMNSVDLITNTGIMNLTMGEPEPTDIVATRNGDLYWTCRSAGVILRRSAMGVVEVVLRGLNKPTGIAANKNGTVLYFTEVPTPGVSAKMGGGNFVWEYSLTKGTRTIISYGDAQPTDIAVTADNRIFFTNTSEGQIIEARRSTFGW
jgi:hypothetical protein